MYELHYIDSLYFNSKRCLCGRDCLYLICIKIS
nr:MAG TPA_asm: hypothetical protein [Caudoviricetes sp.]